MKTEGILLNLNRMLNDYKNRFKDEDLSILFIKEAMTCIQCLEKEKNHWQKISEQCNKVIKSKKQSLDGVFKTMYDFWNSENNPKRNAVIYVENKETNNLIIYTRGEYKEQLKDFILNLSPTNQNIKEYVGLMKIEHINDINTNELKQCGFLPTI